jgi:hypothetical protein
MQQMSEEEMIALQQEQAQLQADQQMSGQNEGMMQEEPQIDEEKIQLITQQIEQALQQGAPPEEVVTQLLKAQIPPDLIEEIFVELGMPQQEVKQLLMSLIQNVENEQAQQIDPRQQQQQMSEEDMMAMQQQDPRQMQQAPMAYHPALLPLLTAGSFALFGESEAAATRTQPLAAPTASIPLLPDSLRLEIVTLDSVWVSLTSDNLASQEFLFGANRTRSWMAKERFLVTMGNAGGATFRLNGVDLGALGRRGAVVRNIPITHISLKKPPLPERQNP